ncbi:hypothetical protein BHE74_00024796 [Ensete ventricosum]|nr:hypothetical protein BHE74_00024796 [Ensete ventricosum]
MAYFCFDFRCACDAPTVTNEALSRGSQAWPRPAPLQGRSATYKGVTCCSRQLRPGPLQGVVGCGQAPCKGWSVAARPPARGVRLQPRTPCKGAAGCGQAPSKGRPLARAVAPRARPAAANPQGAVASGQAARACCPRCNRKGQPPTAKPQVVAARCKATRGSPADAGRSDRQQGQRLRKAAPPVREVSPEGSSAAPCAGQQRRRRGRHEG